MIARIDRPTLVFAGGGTGGHLYPGVAVARALPSFRAVFFVPRGRGDEERLGGEFECRVLSAPRADRRPWAFPALLGAALGRARRALQEEHAVAVVGLGGYASVPACLAARTLGLPVYLMECNAVPGKATRLLARLARGAGLGSEAARARLPVSLSCRVTGTPLRAEYTARAKRAEFGLRPDLPTLLVLGGSQGASGLNYRVLEGISSCRDLLFQVLHCAGPRDAERMRRSYAELKVRGTVVDFVKDIGRAYSVADAVLARSGASTVAECLALRLPSVFVPYPMHKDRQQLKNIGEAERAGAARCVEEHELDPARFRALVHEVLLDSGARDRMRAAAAALGRPGAAADMAAHLLESLADRIAPTPWRTEICG